MGRLGARGWQGKLAQCGKVHGDGSRKRKQGVLLGQYNNHWLLQWVTRSELQGLAGLCRALKVRKRSLNLIVRGLWQSWELSTELIFSPQDRPSSQ